MTTTSTERERLVREVEEAVEMYDASDFCGPYDYAREVKWTTRQLADARAALAAFDAAQKKEENDGHSTPQD